MSHRRGRRLAEEESGLAWVRDGTGVTLLRDGVAQSHVDLSDPTRLEFEYMQHLAALIGQLPPGPLAVTHIGGGALTLARWLHAARPGSPQLVLEPDQEMTALVRRELPLPPGRRIRVRPADGATGLAGLGAASADVVVLDAYAAGRTPSELTTVEFFGQVARVLRDQGAFLANLADDPGLRYVARVAAAAARHWPALLLVADHAVLKGRRFGNVVLAASRREWDTAELGRRLARLPFPAGLRDGAAVARLTQGAVPFTSADSRPSPPPPPPGHWRRATAR